MRSAFEHRQGPAPVPPGRPDGISRGFRPGPGGWLYAPPDRDRSFEPFGSGTGEEPRVEAPHGAPGHPRAFHGYLQGAGQRGEQAAAGRLRIDVLMTKSPEALTPETTIEAAAQRMTALRAGLLPVVDSRASGRLIGVLTEHDIVALAVARGKDHRTPLSECMSRDFEAVNKNDGIDEVREVMHRRRVSRLPVTDREGRLVGIVDEADLGVEVSGVRRTGSAGPGREPPREPPRPESARSRGGFVFGPTDQGGDVGFRPGGSRGWDAW